MRTLYFFTASFPYGAGEQFIETELPYLAKQFPVVEIFPLYVNIAASRARAVPANVVVHKPLLPNSRAHRLIGGIKGAVWRFAFDEWRERRPRGVAQKKKLLKSALIVGAVMSDGRALAIANKASADDVLYFYWGAGSCYLLPFAQTRLAPSVVRFHNSDLYEETTGGYLPFRRALLRCADYVVSISDDGAAYLREKYPAMKVEPHVFRLGTEEFGRAKSSIDNVFRICSCSSITSVKRVDLIARVLSKVSINVEWTHIGDGPLRGMLDEVLSNKPANLSVRMLGRISNEAVKQFYRENPVDLFINLSTHEGVPVSVMEALSAGIPIFATDCGGVSELVDSTVGKLVDVNLDVDILADEIEQFGVARDPQIREEARRRWREMCNAATRYEQFASYLDAVEYRGQSS